MNKIKTVMLDLDGVIANFRKGIHDVFNQPYDYSNLTDKWSFWEDWNGVTFDMINSACTVEFWQNLEWMHDGRDILRSILNMFNTDQIYLLTTPMPNIESPTGKWLWVRDNIPVYLKRTIITQVSKSLLAGPDTLLIDDRDKNVDEFEEAGGKTILVPRPWNRSHDLALLTSKVVERGLRRIIDEQSLSNS